MRAPGGPESEGVGVNNGDVFVSAEVVEIKRQDPLHLVDAHRGNDPGIMNLDPGDSMPKHEFPPRGKNLWRLRKNPENRLEAVQTSGRLLRGKA